MKNNKSFVYVFRAFLEKVLSKNLFNLVRGIYKKLYYSLEFVLRIFNYILLYVPNIYLRYKKIYFFCFEKLGIGDRLIITSVLEHYKKVGRVILVNSTNDVYKNLGIKRILLKDNLLNRFIILFLTNSWHSNIIGAFGDFQKASKNATKRRKYRDSIFSKRKDILAELETAPIKPVVKFSKEEVREFTKKYKKLLSSDYGIVISGSYLNGLPTVKDVGKEKIQKVVDKVKFEWVQTGTKDEPLLRGVMDLRQLPLREAFFIVSKSKIVVTPEGMLTQLAGAFDIPCVTIYTGFIYPEAAPYKYNFPVQPNPLPPCAYCWDHVCKRTGSHRALCSKDIRPKDIIKTTLSILKKKGFYRVGNLNVNE